MENANRKTVKSPPFHAIIVAGGQGERFGSEIPKQYRLLHGKPVIRHILDKFVNFPGLQSLIVVIHPLHSSLYRKAAEGLPLPPPFHGGLNRQSSVYEGLRQLKAKPDDIVLIHDAVRPLVSNEEITNVLDALQHHDAASLAIPVSDTLRKDKEGFAGELANRAGLFAMQTPQAFRYGILKKSHEAGFDKASTDDTSLVTALGTDVKLVEGSKRNIKITFRDDLRIAERLLDSAMTETRTGMGFDVHAFAPPTGQKKLILCGIEIDHEVGLEGHSDADVALHALTDAVLGAVGAGDIGLHFPPSDPKFKDMDSGIFLQHACEIVKVKGGSIINADITIICEQPKITPYRNRMQQSVSRILDIDSNRVNIKATTTEGLGFTGRSEGIAAQAVVTISLGAATS